MLRFLVNLSILNVCLNLVQFQAEHLKLLSKRKSYNYYVLELAWNLVIGLQIRLKDQNPNKLLHFFSKGLIAS
ncbi:MAG: hypothetical protein AAF847_02785 [Bacteroidota bacterium]